ncbi:MAG: S24 family peptidase [Bryobacterales bacterium]|nr:S24 family peptidase [Bryobacterales bacterium]
MAPLSSATRAETIRGESVLLTLHPPGAASATGVAVGVLLLDPQTDRLHVRIRDAWPGGLDAADREVLHGIAAELRERAETDSGAALLGWLEDSFSHILRVSERQAVLLTVDEGPADAERRADALFARHAAGENRASKRSPSEIIPFRTHLPFYPMRIAAGVFAGDAEVEVSGWVPVPEGLRPDPRYFVGRIDGRSMEPTVPDASFCLFRAHPQGSREGKLLLVQKHGTSETGGEFAIKRYHSEKAVLPAGAVEEFDDAPEWRHSRVRLISLNANYPSWDLEADQCQVIAELVRVLHQEEIPEDLRGG